MLVFQPVRRVQQLAELVGKNLYQLSSLAGLTAEQYEQQVLPCVCEQIVQCGDTLAQQYLLEVRARPQFASTTKHHRGTGLYDVNMLRSSCVSTWHKVLGARHHGIMSMCMKGSAGLVLALELARTVALPAQESRSCARLCASHKTSQ